MSLQLRLLGGFELRVDGMPTELPPSAQRVVAYVGLHERPVLRPRVAGTLWLDTSDHQALANLRSVLWRLRRLGLPLLDSGGEHLAVGRDLAVDVRRLVGEARRVVDGAGAVDRQDLSELEQSDELLPAWSDDWVVIERERYRQLRLHALERLCGELTAVGKFGRAIQVGLAAVAEEPLRESAQRVLISAHLAEGNAGEALRQFRGYEVLMREELGLAPSIQMEQLVRGIRNTQDIAPIAAWPRVTQR